MTLTDALAAALQTALNVHRMAMELQEAEGVEIFDSPYHGIAAAILGNPDFREAFMAALAEITYVSDVGEVLAAKWPFDPSHANAQGYMENAAAAAIVARLLPIPEGVDP